MSEARLTGLERRVSVHDEDIRLVYREVRWLRRAVSSLMTHLGAEPPAEEEE